MDTQHIIQLFHLLGTRKIRVSNGWVAGNCPFAPWLHPKGEDRRPSFGIATNKESYFHCFACGVKGYLHHLPFMLSQYTLQVDGIIENYIRQYKDTYDIDNLVSQGENTYKLRELFNTFEEAHEVLNLTKDDITKWQLKYDKDKNTLVFPITYRHELKALKGRNLRQKGFMYYEGSANIKREGLWYGMDMTGDKHPSKIILCEGERDVILLSRRGFTAWGALGSLTKKQIQIVRQSNIPFVLFFDNDNAGQNMQRQIIDACNLFNELYVVNEYGSCKDPAELIENKKLKQAILSITKL
jgi:5S rRNA maturation endonuclease (ribonuclease M5)